MKKTICLILSFLLAVPLLFFVPANVEAAAEYQYVKIDDSRTFNGGTFRNYFKYPKLKGDSQAVKKINRALKKEGESHVKMSGYTMKDIEEFIAHDYENYQTKCEYYNTVDGKAAFNSDDIFSIRYSFAWFAGGVGNGDIYGDTFDLKTGKKLNIMQVVDSKYSDYTSLRNAIYKKLKKKYEQEAAEAFLTNYDTEKKLKNADFYVTARGKVVVCFRTYDISYGAAGCLTVTLT